ncbi:WD40-repeat-containing domain protein [Tribonema minus]|uniref:WD40-repeat-containing domain protein n=1 Tax=Tribonema minus TaxID=303371 RepID=A0A835YM34_9STRA|nr:WD40-repeat-containing domain protein [Tribonema minus]
MWFRGADTSLFTRCAQQGWSRLRDNDAQGSSSRHVDDDTIAGGASAWAKKLSLRASRGPDDTLAADQVQSRDSDSLKKTALSPRPVLTTRSSTLHDALEMSLPCTSLAFRPDGDGTLTANVLVAGFADGTLQHWHAPSGKRLSKMAVGGSDPNTSASAGVFGLEILSVAYAHSGDCFSAGGSDGKVRLFSEETRQALAVLQPGIGFQFGAAQNGGHSGRVFAQKFSREDPNMLVSAGWDNCVHVWDIRQAGTSTDKARSTLTIFGPHVCGDACDMTQQTLVTGSCRNTEQMQFWDMRTGKVMEQISWGSLTAGGGGDTACRLYAAGFSHTADADGRFVAAGGGDGANEARVYQLANGRLASDSLIGSLLGLSAGVLTLDFAPTGDKMAIGLGNAALHLQQYAITKEALL